MFPQTGRYRQKPCDLFGRYADFVKALVERYDGDGVDDFPDLKFPVRFWEVINEPEPAMNGWFFVGSAADYLDVLRVTHDAIVEADPDAKILNGGMAGPQDPGFWDGVFSGGGPQYIDILNHHSIGQDDRLQIPGVQSLFARYGLPGDRKWWIPEVTFNWRAFPRRPQTTREAGAVILCSHLFAFSEGVAKLFYAPLGRLAPNVSPEFALLVPQAGVPGGYVRQETFFAYGTMVRNVDYFDEVNRLWDDPGTYQIVRGRRVTYGLCGDFVPVGIKGTVRITDLVGARSTVPAADLAGLPKPLYVHHMIAAIDVKPGEGVAPISLASQGTIPVAVLSSPDFNAPDEVDLGTLTFGAAGSEESLAFCNAAGEDVNEDGLPDLVCHFRAAQTGFRNGDFEGILEGQTTARVNIRGRDFVRIVGASQ